MFLEKLAFRAVKTNLRKLERPVAAYIVFWKENTWSVKKRSIKLGLDTFETCFSSFVDVEVRLNKNLEISDLKSPDNNNILSYW